MAEDWSWITGHLHTLAKQSAHLPPDAFVELASRDYARTFRHGNAYLMDYWPVYPAMLHVFSPQLANQVSTQYNLPKLKVTADVLEPIAGGPNLVVMNGAEWKKWRGIFSSGFGSTNMLDLVPDMTQSIEVFRSLLRERAGCEIIRLDDMATRLTMDVILRMTLYVITSSYLHHL
jgi:cytochrome P450